MKKIKLLKLKCVKLKVMFGMEFWANFEASNIKLNTVHTFATAPQNVIVKESHGDHVSGRKHACFHSDDDVFSLGGKPNFALTHTPAFLRSEGVPVLTNGVITCDECKVPAENAPSFA